MAAFIPIIKDLVPLVMPSSIHITRAKDLQPPPDEMGKVSTSPAITGISGKLSASSKDPPSLSDLSGMLLSFRPFSRKLALTTSYQLFLATCCVHARWDNKRVPSHLIPITLLSCPMVR